MSIFRRKKIGQKSDINAECSLENRDNASEELAECVSEHSKLPVVRELFASDASNLFEMDQFRSLRTKLFFPSSGKRPRAVVVTGAGVGEGKSFIAANLAVCIAQNVDNRQTLLIDCDMRVPAIHRLFGFDDSPGLSDYLSSDTPISALLMKTNVEKLTILPGGSRPLNPAELLSSVKMSELLREVQTRYDDRYIVLDLPSPRLVAEAELIARQADGAIIVVAYGKTPKQQVKELVEILGKDRVLGIVFNRFDTSMHSSVYRLYRKFIRRK